MYNAQVFIFHHTFDKPIPALLSKCSEESLHVRFVGKSPLLNMKPEDPVVVFIPLDNTYYIKSGDVDYIDPKQELTVIKLDMTVNMKDRRVYKRYPAYQFCEVREVFTKKKGTAILKNISNNGMLLVSKNDFQLGDAIETSICVGAAIYFIEGKIVRAIKGNEYGKYGVVVKKSDVASIKNIREFMKMYQCVCLKNIDYDLVDLANEADLVFDLFGEFNTDKRLSDAALKLDEVLKKNR